MTKILLVEDEEYIREEIADWLMFEGFEVVSAENGREGLDLAQTEKPDLILCDVRMPIMNGHEMLAALRADPHLAHIPFVFASAAAEKSAVRKGLALGAARYVIKPFSFDEIMEAITSVLAEQ